MTATHVMSARALILGTLVLCAGHASGQTVTNAPAATPAPPASTWSFSASVYSYLLPDEGNYAQPTVTLDRDWLHLEARYNYEDLETGSAWIGYTFGGGDTVAWELTPMIGGVFGATDGVAPGCKGTLTWRKLELYSEGEYVFDAGDSSGSFFYNWSEVAIAPVSWLRAGLVTQRTRAHDADREIQRGFLVGVSYKALSFTTYVFNPDDSKPIVVLGASVAF